MIDLSQPLSLEDYRNLALAAALGFLIGLEREWSDIRAGHDRTFAGVRTFTLVSFFGGLCALISPGGALVGIGLALIGALVLVAYWNEARQKPGLGATTETALFSTYLLGVAAALGALLLAAGGAVAVAVILSAKHYTHRVAAALTEAEIRALLRFLVVSVIVLPLLPNEGLGPYDALNPRELWLMVVLISGLSFIGYWLSRLLGTGRGIPLASLVGGLASSTATTVSLSRMVADGSVLPSQAAGGILLSNGVMVARVALVIAAISPVVLLQVWPALLAACLAGLAVAAYLLRSGAVAVSDHPEVGIGNPLELGPAMLFAGLLGLVTLASTFGARQIGGQAIFGIAALTGLVDVDAVTVAATRQVSISAVGVSTAGHAVLIALGVNMMSKVGYAGFAAGWGTARMVAVGIGAAVFSGLVVAILPMVLGLG